ncbi:MAG: AraC family transcriptional regulator [Bacteroidales bacterium]|nr:AraC family transcriptional regulator [Bacteroidales bacterium]
MKLKICKHRLIRLLSLFVVVLLAILDVLMGNETIPDCLRIDVYCATLLLMLYPVNKDSVHFSLAVSLSSLALFILLKVLRTPGWLLLTCAQLVILFSGVHKVKFKYAEIPPLFHVSAVWGGVEDYMHLFHVAVFLSLGFLIVAPVGSALWSWLSLALAALFYSVQYYRVFTRSTVLLGARKEEQIKSGQRGSEFKQPVQYVDSDCRSAVLFNEVVRIMEVRKPYLQDDFSVDDLARMTHTNRLYLSRSINFHSGRNFNQLVNHYRIKYAVALLKKDPGLKMNELSQMCGFHTVVSFNMAFKLNERMTPSEYARSLKTIN